VELEEKPDEDEYPRWDSYCQTAQQIDEDGIENQRYPGFGIVDEESA